MMKDRFLNRRTRSYDVVPFVALGLLIGLVALRGTDIAPFARSMFANFLAPSGTSELSYLSKDALISRLDDAETKLSRVSYENALYELVVKENETLKSEMRYVASGNGVIARVLARPPRTHYDTLILDQGSESGIRVGDLVAAHNVALGRVASVSADASVANLFSSPGNAGDVIVGDPEAVVVSEGLGGGTLEVLVPQGVVVHMGDAVRVHASDTLIVGLVGSVFSAPTDISQTVRLYIPLSLASLDYVRVIPSAAP